MSQLVIGQEAKYNRSRKTYIHVWYYLIKIHYVYDSLILADKNVITFIFNKYTVAHICSLLIAIDT